MSSTSAESTIYIWWSDKEGTNPSNDTVNISVIAVNSAANSYIPSNSPHRCIRLHSHARPTIMQHASARSLRQDSIATVCILYLVPRHKQPSYYKHPLMYEVVKSDGSTCMWQPRPHSRANQRRHLWINATIYRLRYMSYP